MKIRCNDCKYCAVQIGEYPCSDCVHGDGRTEHFDSKATPNENRCICCGAIIPEGRHICLACEGTDDMQTFKPHGRQPLTTPETVNHPAHYQGKHECIDEMISLFGVEAVKGFCMCNVYKYRFRAARKNGKEDIAKADWYMEKLMELEGANNGNG